MSFECFREHVPLVTKPFARFWNLEVCLLAGSNMRSFALPIVRILFDTDYAHIRILIVHPGVTRSRSLVLKWRDSGLNTSEKLRAECSLAWRYGRRSY